MDGIDRVALRELRRRFEGQILAPDDPGYDDARRVWNAMVDKRPAVIAKCRGREDVAAAVSFARQTGLEVAVRAGGHSVSGSSSTDGGLVIDLTLMRTVTVDPEARVAKVGGGALLRHMDGETQRFGLATTGGMVSHTGVGGLTLGGGYGYLSRRFGLACDNLLAAEVVLADGEVVRCGRRTRKGVAGYDLTRLFVGSEGTLGVITEITLALRPAAEESLTLAALFHSVSEAGAAVIAIAESAAAPSLLELIDAVHLRAIEALRPMGLPASAAALLLSAVDSGIRAPADLAVIEECCRRSGATEVHVSSDLAEADALLAARRLAHPAMESLAAATFPAGVGALIIDDVAVPVSRLTELLDGVAFIAEEQKLVVGLVGHAGDGNMHPNIVVDRTDPASMARGRAAFDQIMALGLALGGTCTGEHGVGLLKREWLAKELGPTGVRLHRAIKDAFDPLGILNPGKVLPPRRSRA